MAFIVDLRINETLQTGAVRNRTYRGAKVLFIFRIHHSQILWTDFWWWCYEFDGFLVI